MGRGWFLWLVQRCVGEVLAGEEDVKKDERWFLGEGGTGLRGGLGLGGLVGGVDSWLYF